MQKRFEFQIQKNDHKKRLDQFLFGTFPEIGKKFLRGVLKAEKCEVNGYVANGGLVLKQNDFVEIEFDYASQNKMYPEKIPLNIIFEDAQIIVLDKPAGMLIHPTPRNRTGTLLNGLMYHLNQKKIEPPRRGDVENQKEKISDVEFEISKNGEAKNPKSKIQNPKSDIVRPGLIHRLDRQTSGLVVIAKTHRALRILNNHFKRKLVDKRYLAVVEGIIREGNGKIEAPIGRYEDLRQWNIKSDGKAAETRFWVKERFENKTLVELEPVTGRTNQLRIHCAYIGHPILGDEWHGKQKFERLCLHASSLEFWHPDGGERLKFKSTSPDFLSTAETQRRYLKDFSK